MKLYHATKKENTDSILKQGLLAVESTRWTGTERLDGEFVYGFDNAQDAVDFMVWDNNTDEDDVVVFCFDADNAIIDTEYDENNAFAVPNNVKDVQIFSEL